MLIAVRGVLVASAMLDRIKVLKTDHTSLVSTGGF